MPENGRQAYTLCFLPSPASIYVRQEDVMTQRQEILLLRNPLVLNIAIACRGIASQLLSVLYNKIRYNNSRNTYIINNSTLAITIYNCSKQILQGFCTEEQDNATEKILF